MRTLTSTSSTLRLRSSSASLCATSSSLSDTHRLQDLACVDGLEAVPGFVRRDLPLGGIAVGHREKRRGTELLRYRRDPLEEIVDPLPRGKHLSAREVDEHLREPVPDRTPEVLLDQSVRVCGQLLALVHRTRDAGREREEK